MDLLLGILAILIGICVGIILCGLILGLGALVIWGIGNGIIWLFAIPAVWTYWQSFIVMFILWGIKFIINNFIRRKGK